MNIPDKAIDAAQEFAYHNLGPETTAHDVELIVQAAAPFIAAQVLRDEADLFQQHADISQDHGHQELCESFETSAGILRMDADDFELS